jgi:hypothetical protein
VRNPKGPLPPQESVELSVSNRATMQPHEGSANKTKAAIRAKTRWRRPRYRESFATQQVLVTDRPIKGSASHKMA